MVRWFRTMAFLVVLAVTIGCSEDVKDDTKPAGGDPPPKGKMNVGDTPPPPPPPPM